MSDGESKEKEQKDIEPEDDQKILVTIEVISAAWKHPNADLLHVVRVQGYDVILNLTAVFGPDATPENVIGKRGVFFQIDSVLPTSFASQSFWNYLHDCKNMAAELGIEGKRVKTARIRGVVSQGLFVGRDTVTAARPDLAEDMADFPVGTDLTRLLGVVKYVSVDDADRKRPSPATLRPFPDFLTKTDQPRLQSDVELLNRTEGRLWDVQIKFDGQSVQWFCREGQVGVCSRNFEVSLEYDQPEDKRDQGNNKYRRLDAKYRLLDSLKEWCRLHRRNLSIQTEVYGLGINKNNHKKPDVDMVVFDVFDIDRHRLLPFRDVKEIAKALSLPVIPSVFENQPVTGMTVDDFVKLAQDQRYDGKWPAEGIVVKTADDAYPYVHFKVISPEFLLAHKA